MDFSLLNNTSDVTPILVKLYDNQQLYGMAKNRTPEARVELVDAVCELLDIELTIREAELIADVMIEVMRQAEFDLRQALSEKLAVMDNVPFRLALHIANDEIGVAAPVLRHSAALGDLDLIYIVKSKPAEYWREIAARKTLNEQLINLLAETRDFDTAMSLVENNGIQLTETSLTILSDLAQGEDELAAPLLKRSEMCDEMASNLYEFVGEQLKAYMRENYTIADQNIAVKALESTVEDVQNDNVPSVQIFAAQKMAGNGALTIKNLIGILKHGRFDSFMAQFCIYTGVAQERMREMLSRENGQGLALLCKAHGVIKTDFISLFLLTNSLRNHGEMIDVSDMNKAVNYYDRITPDIARQILGGAFTH